MPKPKRKEGMYIPNQDWKNPNSFFFENKKAIEQKFIERKRQMNPYKKK